jgi:5-methylcytosine-specific restriction endonuclease McrA
VSTTHVPADLRRLVRARAGECCEYCRIPESASFVTHQVDHVVAEKHGGETVADNLAMSCALCNVRKGSDIASIDSDTGLLTPLFHP